MGKIIIIGLGPGSEDDLTLKAVEELKSNRKTYIRTIFHPTISYLDREGIDYESFDKYYEREDEFIDVYKSIVKELLEKADEFGKINYCVPGHPLIAEKTVELLIEEENKNNIDIEIINGLSFIEPVILSMKRDPVNGLKLIDGLSLEQKPDINMDNLITQVYSRERASELKLSLMEIYDDYKEVYIIDSAGMKDERKEKMYLYQIDRIEWLGYLSSIYIPKTDRESKSSYDLNDLIMIMEILRSEDGCSWDRKQDHNSLRAYLIEEAYEVVDAIDNDDMDSLQEELGDLLLQIVFHSQIAREEGYFNIWDTIKSISEKMIDRHPNVFETSIHSEEDNWEEIKAKEKNFESHSERLLAVPKALPALIRSNKVQKRASRAGFDWDDYRGALDKIYEEIEEVKTEIELNSDRVGEEIGDLLFSVVNLSRFFKVDPEKALQDTIEKFIIRFKKIEDYIISQGKTMEEVDLNTLDSIWNKVK
ncbi:MAG: nucleoside triphosphate pyrophosphohydrolase [Andreesenia angusta]|nr:nucleoside triphosphate pyrophosphohydrolase [Andreesenia angusta]